MIELRNRDRHKTKEDCIVEILINDRRNSKARSQGNRGCGSIEGGLHFEAARPAPWCLLHYPRRSVQSLYRPLHVSQDKGIVANGET